MFTFICVHFNFLCSFSSSFSPPFSIYFLTFLLCCLHLILLGSSSSSSCQLAFLLFCCLYFYCILLFPFSIDKGWPTILSGTEILMCRSQSRLCFDYLKNFCHSRPTLFPVDGGSSLPRKINAFYTHTHISPQSSVRDTLL